MAKGNMSRYRDVIREYPEFAAEVLELAYDHDLQVHVAFDALFAAMDILKRARKATLEECEKYNRPINPNISPIPYAVEDAKSAFTTAKAKRTRSLRKGVGHNTPSNK